jgi:hypothetical protein
MDRTSSTATMNVTSDTADDDIFPKSAAAAAARGREFAVGAPGSDPDHLHVESGMTNASRSYE